MTAQVEQLDVPESSASTEDQPDPALLWGEKQRVLLIDDDPIQLQIASATLGGHEYDVTTADDGWDGINTLKEQDFNLVVVDLDMPRLDGYGFIVEARKLEKCQHLPIMVVSGRQDVVSIDRAYDAGASSFMDKPVNWDLFRRQVRCVLRNADTQNRLRDIGASARKDASLANICFKPYWSNPVHGLVKWIGHGNFP
ncbi:MAG: hypothetical protein COA47_02820 [Robiginitomaculum sp.]|nr:MAG: hypothetical protein COA47_02820 [Robiginitomaculum sp.]